MGTNFYAIDPPCPCCKRAGERVHIGKSSTGWAFSFRSYPPQHPDNFPGCPDDGLTCRQDWYAYLTRGNRTIEDEYGREYTFMHFTNEVERTRGGLTARTASEAQWGPTGRDIETQDEDGFRFTTREFS